jgi:hypothetical protein
MSNDLTTAYFAITKADKNDDGTLMVYGKATDDSLDIDEQICDPVWLDTAMPNWFKTGGNIREQHSSIAAGVAKEYEKKADGHYINVLVVDPVSVKKVDSGVLKGFSIGIKSPRVIRDTKAANGRIIDGQIVEVSLVDRPANPNCQLLLAKSVDGESGVWKVEELIEKSEEVTPETTEVVAEVVPELVQEVIEEVVLEAAVEEAPVAEETPVAEEAAVEEIPIAEIVEEAKLEELGIEKSAKAKAILAEIVKFDKTKYEAAREALAGLIEVEAGEMKQGSNEIYSISHLLEAVAHLAMWYEGEEAEGEVMEEVKEASVEAETEKADDSMKCMDCNKAEKECMCKGGYKAPKTEAPKSAEPEEKISEVTEEVATEDIEAIVEKAVKSATESIRSEVALLVAAKEAAIDKAATLESELATAKSLAIGGGPKRTAKPIDSTTNDLMTKALVFKAKANAATDPTLAKGYKALSEEFLAAYEAETK